jgi:hypothetical protein
MHRDHHIFIEALKCKKKVSITILGNSESKQYVPLFYTSGYGRKENARYYVWDGEKGVKGNISGLAPEKIVSIESTQEHFEPACFTLVREDKQSLGFDLLDFSEHKEINP